MPRVLEVFAPLDGGVAEHVLRLAEGLAPLGVEAEVAAPRGSEFVPKLRALGLEVHELPFVRAPGPRDAAAARALRALDRHGRFDVVHAHSSKAGALVRAGLPRAGRFVYTPHCFAFSGAFGGAGRALYRGAERLLLRRTAALIAASEWERREALHEIDAPPELVHVVYCGTRPCADGPPSEELRAFAAGRPLVGMVSVLRPQKDPLALVRAAALLRDGGRLGFRVAIVGNGELAGEIRAEIARLDLGSDVALFPFAGDVQPYLRALDVFALPSLWESLPISVMEAMACGVPVVASDVSGMGEAVADGVTGRLVPPGAPDALAEALAALMGDPEARAAAGREARAAYEQRFRLEPMREAITGIYRSVAAPPGLKGAR